MLFRRNVTKKEYLINMLEKELKRASKGTMPKSVRVAFAKRTIERMDLTNPYQTHKSIQGYADILFNNYKKKEK